MPENLEAITVSAMGLAMDAAVLRQEAIASNIANASTPGYQPISVNFESQLEDARMAMQDGGRLDAASLAGVEPHLETVRNPIGGGLTPKVMIDLEVANLAQNAVQYQMLAKGLSKHFEILSTAFSDGKK